MLKSDTMCVPKQTSFINLGFATANSIYPKTLHEKNII